MTVAASAKERSCINMHQPHPLLLVPPPKSAPIVRRKSQPQSLR